MTGLLSPVGSLRSVVREALSHTLLTPPPPAPHLSTQYRLDCGSCQAQFWSREKKGRRHQRIPSFFRASIALAVSTTETGVSPAPSRSRWWRVKGGTAAPLWA